MIRLGGVRATTVLLLVGLTGGASAHPRPSQAPLTPQERLAAEARLAEHGYWTGAIDGRWDELSRHALLAFQKVTGRKRTGQWTREEYRALMVADLPKPLERGPAHIEIDLRRQVLLLVGEGGEVAGILPVSTGNGREFVSEGWARDAITPPGWYEVFKKIPGRRKSSLGLLYYPIYFMYGTAIHGAPSVPSYPASHGCVRVPMGVARRLYEMVPVGMPVVIHTGGLPPRPAPLPVGSRGGATPLPASSDGSFHLDERRELSGRSRAVLSPRKQHRDGEKR
ncbi:MAG: L,D-transpeptidase family protein [Blastocatellia bacterium]